MLLSSGCSFTAGQYGEHIVYEAPYPTILSSKLQSKYVNLSAPGSDNIYIIQSLIHYILVKNFDGFDEMYVTVQLSDFFRKLVFNRKQSGTVQPCDINSQINLRKRFKKINNFGRELVAKEASTYVITLARHETLENTDLGKICTIQKGKDVVQVGDATFNYQKLETLIALNSLKAICDQRGIKLAIINYYGFGEWKDDLLLLKIKENFVIDNPQFGLYNELLWLGFNRPDNYHFDLEAHEWQASMLYDYFKYNKQITVREDPAPNSDNTNVYDYTDDI